MDGEGERAARRARGPLSCGRQGVAMNQVVWKNNKQGRVGGLRRQGEV